MDWLHYPLASLAQLLLLALLGYQCFPLLRTWIKRRAWSHKKRLMEARLPQACALLSLHLLAGGATTAALKQLSKTPSVEPLANELDELLQRVSAGAHLETALNELDRRWRLPGLSLMVQTITVSLSSGSPLGEQLGLLSQHLEDERMTTLEVRYAKVAIHILAPLFICIMPAVFLIFFYPLFYKLRMAFENL